MERSLSHSNEGACQTMYDCSICLKHKQLDKGYVLYDDEDWLITHAHNGSGLLGYCYLEPKKHYENWSDFEIEQLAKIGVLIKRVEQALRKEISIERLYVVTISEAVRHLHFHLIPREKDASLKGVTLISAATSPSHDGRNLSKEVILEFVGKLKKNIEFAKTD